MLPWLAEGWAHSPLNFNPWLKSGELFTDRYHIESGPVGWNSLPDYLKSSDLSFNCFRQQLKTFLFCKHWHQSQHYFSALDTLLNVDALQMHDTYLLTYTFPAGTNTLLVVGEHRMLAAGYRFTDRNNRRCVERQADGSNNARRVNVTSDTSLLQTNDYQNIALRGLQSLHWPHVTV